MSLVMIPILNWSLNNVRMLNINKIMYTCYTLNNNEDLPCPVVSPLKRGGRLTFFFSCATYISLNWRSYVNLSTDFRARNQPLVNQSEKLEYNFFSLSSIAFFYIVFLWDNIFLHEMLYVYIIYLTWFCTHTTVKDVTQIWNKPQRTFHP